MHECASWLISILFIIMITIIIINTSNKHLDVKKEEELFQEPGDISLNDFSARNIALINADVLNNLNAGTVNANEVNTSLLNMSDQGSSICFGYSVSGNNVNERLEKCIGPSDIINVKNLGAYIENTGKLFNNQIGEVRGKCDAYNNSLQKDVTSLRTSINTATSTNVNSVESRLKRLEDDTAKKINEINSRINTVNRVSIPDVTRSVQATLTDIDGKCGGLAKQITDVKNVFDTRLNKLETVAR